VFTTIAKLPGHQLRFHKRSKDGSSKCDIFHTGEHTDAVWGVIFNIPAAEKSALDRAEGRGSGYDERIVVLTLPNGEQLKAVTYAAEAKAIVEDLAPYSWYKDFVASGATEHGLPADYVETVLGRVVAMRDPDVERERRERMKLRP
jgi:AIG2-like family